MTRGQCRVVSWNIERGYFPEQCCHFLQALNADIYLLTELDRGNKRTAKVDMFEKISGALDMPGHFAVEFIEHDSLWRSIIRQGGPGGGTHGNAVFSRRPIENYRSRALPTNDRLRWDGKTYIPELFEPRSGQRNAQIFECQLGSKTVTFINTHLENWRCEWSHRKAQLSAALESIEGPTLIAGDFNPIGGVLKTIYGRESVNLEVRQLRAFLEQKGLDDPFSNEDYTMFSWGTRSKFDWIALSPELKVSSQTNLRSPLSDHNCLVVDFEID
ncbi:MAG: endonuclease/exonuclease/phosphatase family protein [Planctomycetota bacterium]|nr:endonuclease/exonuclease/phosphatase family protein [Planctomycetota bacterium]